MAKRSRYKSGKSNAGKWAKEKDASGNQGWNLTLDLSKYTDGMGDDEKKAMFFKPPLDEKRILDVIPYVTTSNPDADEGDLWHCRRIIVHRKIGPEGMTVLCSKTFGENKKCPICEEYSKLNSGSDKEREQAKLLKPKLRDLFNVIDRTKGGEGAIQLWDVSPFNFTSLLKREYLDAIEEDGENEVRYFGSLKDGCSIKVRFEPKTMGEGKPYSCADAISFKDRDDYGDDILDDVYDLDAILNEMTYDELRNELYGIEDEDVVNDDPEANELEPEQSEPENKEPESSKCPNDGEWGKDYEERDACTDCGEWEECKEAKEKLEPKRSRRNARDREPGETTKKESPRRRSRR